MFAVVVRESGDDRRERGASRASLIRRSVGRVQPGDVVSHTGSMGRAGTQRRTAVDAVSTLTSTLTRAWIALVLVETLLPLAAIADEPMPIAAHDRARIGWVCAYWSERVVGDFDGNGRADHAVFYDLAPRTRRCWEEHVPERWRATVFLDGSGGGRVDLRLPACDNAPSRCGILPVDLDGNSTDELATTTSGGLQSSDWTFYTLVGRRLMAVLYLGSPGRTSPALHSRAPAILGRWTGITYRSDWGCRRTSAGRTMVLAFDARARGRSAHGLWRVDLARLAFDGGSLVLLGRREVIRSPKLGGSFPRPSLPTVGPCGAMTSK